MVQINRVFHNIFCILYYEKNGLGLIVHYVYPMYMDSIVTMIKYSD